MIWRKVPSFHGVESISFLSEFAAAIIKVEGVARRIILECDPLLAPPVLCNSLHLLSFLRKDFCNASCNSPTPVQQHSPFQQVVELEGELRCWRQVAVDAPNAEFIRSLGSFGLVDFIIIAPCVWKTNCISTFLELCCKHQKSLRVSLLYLWYWKDPRKHP